MTYALKELAKRWNKTENDILRMAIKNEIELSARWRGSINVYEEIDEGYSFFKYSCWINDLFPIDGQKIKELLTNTLPVLIHQINRDGDVWHFSMNSPDESEEGPNTSFNLTRDKIFITSEQIEATEVRYPRLAVTVLSRAELHKSPVELGTEYIPKGEAAQKKGGPKKLPFQAAIEKAYLYFKETEKSYILQPGNIDLFIKEIADLMKRATISCPNNEKEIINQLEMLINPPKKVTGAWKIRTQEVQENKPRGRNIVDESKTYEKKDVSKQLTLLRGKYPLPL